MNRTPRVTKREQKAARPIPESERYTIRFDGRDVAVPFVAAWSSELPNVRVAPEPLLGGRKALFRGSGRRGEGRPILGKMDMGRQRLCMLRQICQVCAQPIRDQAWHVLLEDPAKILGGRAALAVREPPACTSCMTLSLQICPGLRRDRPRIVAAKRTTMLITQTIPPIGGFGPLLPDGPELDGARIEDTIAGYLKVVIDEILVSYSPEAFLRGAR